jgi:hypothetical protein
VALTDQEQALAVALAEGDADELARLKLEEAELVRLIEEDRRARKRAVRKLRNQARQVYAAAEGWGGVDSMAAWFKTCRTAGKQYEAGRFLMQQLGAERLLDPTLMATLWGIRQQLLVDLGAATAAEEMLVDMAVLNYALALRVNRWIGDAALTLEAQCFGDDPPGVRFKEKWGTRMPESFSVEAVVDRLRLQLLPLFDRANRGVVRNLQALQAMRQPPLAPAPPPVAIARAEQVNVGHQQVNAQNCSPTSGRRGARSSC